MSEAWDQLVTRLGELTDLYSALGLLGWDQAVLMPPRGAESRARVGATLDSMAHARLTDPAIGDLLEQLAGDDSLEDYQAATLRVMRREYDKAVKVPDDLVRELSQATALAYQAWTEAKPNADFALFQPHLEKVTNLKKQWADAVGFANERYDALLDDYEPGSTAIEVEAMFEELTDGLVPVVDAVLGAVRDKPDFLVGAYDEPTQERFSRWLTQQLGFDMEAGRLDTSPHPFTGHIGTGDTRQTTHTRPNDLLSSVYATIHESGHALYDQGLPEEWADLPAGRPPSLGIHESQSRLWENQVGRSRAFTDFLLPHLKSHFEHQLGSVTPDEFYRGANHPERSFIRVEADELTYNLHVLMRFKLELATFRDELVIADLPDAWDKEMENHLGIRPGNDAEGVLQDMHWGVGLQGYFPTYTLGTLYSAALFDKAQGELGDLEPEIRKGETGRLLTWLRENVHAKGQLYPAKELMERILGSPPTAAPFINYIRTKYGELYDVSV